MVSSTPGSAGEGSILAAACPSRGTAARPSRGTTARHPPSRPSPDFSPPRSYLRSRAEVKGQDCVGAYVAMHECVLANATSFDKYVEETDDAVDATERQQGVGKRATG